MRSRARRGRSRAVLRAAPTRRGTPPAERSRTPRTRLAVRRGVQHPGPVGFPLVRPAPDMFERSYAHDAEALEQGLVHLHLRDLSAGEAHHEQAPAPGNASPVRTVFQVGLRWKGCKKPNAVQKISFTTGKVNVLAHYCRLPGSLRPPRGLHGSAEHSQPGAVFSGDFQVHAPSTPDARRATSCTAAISLPRSALKRLDGPAMLRDARQ